MEHEELFEPLFVPLGPRRMQDTLLDFAQPALKRLPPDYTLEELRAMLQFAAAVWNAVVLRDIRGAFEHLAMTEGAAHLEDRLAARGLRRGVDAVLRRSVLRA